MTKQFKPCRLTVHGQRFEIDSTGKVVRIFQENPREVLPVSDEVAGLVKAEAKRRRRNRAARLRTAVYRELFTAIWACIEI